MESECVVSSVAILLGFERLDANGRSVPECLSTTHEGGLRTTMKGRAASESVYYRHSGTVPFASRLSFHVRQKMFLQFMEPLRPERDPSARRRRDERRDLRESNYFEQMYPHPESLTCVGTEDAAHLVDRYPGLVYRQIHPGDALPFRDGEFDIVFSNAVLEHVGSRPAQAAFVRELCRVGRDFFVTTPNRWFPIEHHTGLPLLHYLPASIFRGVLRRTRYRHWAEESNLNILTASEFAALFPATAAVEVRAIRIVGIR